MTSDEIYKLIEANGLTLHGDIEHFAALVASAEREACANIAEEESMRGLPDEKPKGVHLKMAVAQIVCGTFIADAIRARGQA
jgi:hypothetical protein